MKSTRSIFIPVAAVVLTFAALCALRLFHAGLTERLEWVSYDFRVRSALNFPAPCDTNLGFVFIDDASIQAVHHKLLGPPGFGLYWPRQVYGRMVKELATDGAKAIAFDVLFGERRDDQPGVMMQDETLVDSDDYLGMQMRDAGNVILGMTERLDTPDVFATNAAALADVSTDKDSDGVLRKVKAFRIYKRWHPFFREVAADPDYGIDLRNAEIHANEIILHQSTGDTIRIPLDADGNFALADFVGEHIPEGMPAKAPAVHEVRVWHMGIVLAAWELGLNLNDAIVDLPHRKIILKGNGIERVIPVDNEGYFYINWSLPINDPRIEHEPALTVLRRHVARMEGKPVEKTDRWKGKLAVIGSTATGNDLTDYGATPLSSYTFLFSKHWNVANSVITGRFVHRGTTGQEVLILLLAGLLSTVSAFRLKPAVSGLVLFGLLATYGVLAFALYIVSRIWLPMVLPMGAMISAYLVITTWRVLFEQTERKRVKSVFSRVVSPDVVSELLNAEHLGLGGARREITVFFADVRGFTALTDRAQQDVTDEVKRLGLDGEAARSLYDQQARETLDTVNLYLAVVADVIKKHDGTLDKYIGDCVMAFWGAPASNPKHALCCVNAAIEAQRAIAGVNEERTRRNQSRKSGENELPCLSLGTGVNTGLATVGLMGSDAHILNYTVFGRDVNVASRLEGVSGSGRIIISQATYEHLLRDDPALAKTCRELDAVTVKGIREEVKIYEVPWSENR